MSWGRNYGKTERINEPNAEDWKIHNSTKPKSFKACDRCGKDIFFLKIEGGWRPFDAELSEDIPKNDRYADGYDKVKRSDGKSKNKGYRYHFDTCGK